MKSQINLLHNEFTPKFEWVCANHFIGMIVAVISLCLGTYGLTGYYHQQKEEQVAAIKVEIKQQQKSIEELTKALTDRVINPSLQNKLVSFTEQTRTRGLLLNHIRDLSALRQRSFSVLFDSLAQSSSSELWLTHFLVTPDILNIEGQIAKPRALPVWISELSKTDFFKGQEFNLASVEREDSGLFFKLNSVTKSQVSSTLAQAKARNEA
ncbi:MAG: Tfp pilus assembly protein PilN [Alphaproteobacteria bacterium]|jgi:Tfp pilus assembly protein PilN